MILAMPKTVAQFIEENIDDLKKLHKIGIVSCKLINSYSIYTYFKSLNPQDVPEIMSRYTFTAEAKNVSERSVMRAIKEMESTMQ